MARLLPCLPLLLSGCAAGEAALSAADEADTGLAGAAWDGDSSTAPGTTGLGDEVEDDFLELLPATARDYVFVANPARNTLTRIAVPSLDVVTVEVGVDPALVLTTPDGATAVTLNAGSDDVSIVDAETLEVVSVPVLSNLDNMRLSPDGRWAVLFHDADAPDADVPDDGGVVSYNQVSVVDLQARAHHQFVAGTNAHDVLFTPDGQLGLVVCDDVLGMLDLSGDEPTFRTVQIVDDLLDPPTAEEAAITPDGAWAFVRQYGADELVVVDLVTDEVARVQAGRNPTDLDVMPGGDRLAVVARGSGQLLLYSAADPFAPPEIIQLPEDELIGSIQVSPDGSLGVLYTTAAPVAHYTTWDVATGELTVRPLEKPVRAVAINPTASAMMIVHTLEDVAETDAPYLGHWVITLVDLDSFLPNPLVLSAEPTAWVDADSGEVGYFILDGEPLLEMVDWSTLVPWQVDLKSNPVHLGVLPDTNIAYVNQEHELGRLSFFDPGDPSDPSDDVLETITGFELNSQIEH